MVEIMANKAKNKSATHRPPRGEKLEPATYWTTAEEKAAAQKEAKRRGMTHSQLVRLAVNGEVKRGEK